MKKFSKTDRIIYFAVICFALLDYYLHQRVFIPATTFIFLILTFFFLGSVLTYLIQNKKKSKISTSLRNGLFSAVTGCFLFLCLNLMFWKEEPKTVVLTIVGRSQYVSQKQLKENFITVEYNGVSKNLNISENSSDLIHEKVELKIGKGLFGFYNILGEPNIKQSKTTH